MDRREVAHRLRKLLPGLEAALRACAVLAQMYIVVPPSGESWLGGGRVAEPGTRRPECPGHPPPRHPGDVPPRHPERSASHVPLSTVEMLLWSQLTGADGIRSAARQRNRGSR